MKPPMIGFLPTVALQGVAAYLASKSGRRWWIWWLATGAGLWALNVAAELYAQRQADQ